MEENNNNTLQCLTEYKLSDKEKAILEVLLNPEYRTKSITDICKIAGCSRPTYYEAMSKPEFKAIYEQHTKDLIKQSIGPVVNTFVREALRGSFQHGKVILEMAGLYSEKLQVDNNIDININLNADELQNRLIDLISKIDIDTAIEADYKVVDDNNKKEPFGSE